MNGLSSLLSTLGTRQQPPLKVHHSRASGCDAVEMSPDFSRVTSDHNIYPISTHYLHSIYTLSTGCREQQSVTAYRGPVCGEAPPGLGSLLTVSRLRGPDSGYLHTIYTIYNIYNIYSIYSIYPGQEEERRQPSHCSTSLPTPAATSQ